MLPFQLLLSTPHNNIIYKTIEITEEEYAQCDTLDKYRSLMASKFLNYQETNIASATFNYSSTYECPSVIYRSNYNDGYHTLFEFRGPKVKTVKLNVVYAPFYNGGMFAIGEKNTTRANCLLCFHFSSYYNKTYVIMDRINKENSSGYSTSYFNTPRLLEQTGFPKYYDLITPDADGLYNYVIESNGNLIYINYLYIEFEK